MSHPPVRQPFAAPTPADLLRSLAFYLVFYPGTVLLLSLIAIQLLLPRSGLMRSILWWARYHRWCVTRLLGIQVRIEGAVPSGQVLVAMKHESFFEAIDLPMLLPMPAVFAKIELMRIPVWGKAGAHYGLIGVERDQGARALRAMIASARERLAEGRPLAIFPEGTRVPHGTAPPLQSGFAGLYKLLGLPVVPAAVNSGPLYHSTIKRAGTITVRFGEPIAPGLARAEIEARVRAAINALNECE
ncbi:lysophospholipid acyltransferase family protein [Novosphingobium bradum]|uniref:Lysophospholipid acyltransferase family protein n=1 Tax=Novosphingobium bradum TaxID=1737444 RepID=A0ABV7IT08_9SPHN